MKSFIVFASLLGLSYGTTNICLANYGSCVLGGLAPTPPPQPPAPPAPTPPYYGGYGGPFGGLYQKNASNVGLKAAACAPNQYCCFDGQANNPSDGNILSCVPTPGTGTPSCCEINPIYADCQDDASCHSFLTSPSTQCTTVGIQSLCPLSCQSCDVWLANQTPAPEPTAVYPPAPPADCVDSDSTNCPIAAKQGACNQAFYQTNCKLSCDPACVGYGGNPAPAPSGTCVDKDPTNCPIAAKQGACGQAFYQTNCQLSCNPACTSNGLNPAPAPAEDCVDADPTNCPKAAVDGGCAQAFYATNCKLSCKTC